MVPAAPGAVGRAADATGEQRTVAATAESAAMERTRSEFAYGHDVSPSVEREVPLSLLGR